ncbi:MAG: hypothetical protein ACREYC_27640, partial [Gammaproteobacteria bacterium]
MPRPFLIHGKSQMHGALVFFALIGAIGSFGAIGLFLAPGADLFPDRRPHRQAPDRRGARRDAGVTLKTSRTRRTSPDIHRLSGKLAPAAGPLRSVVAKLRGQKRRVFRRAFA